jgi:hypothetical protein
MFLSYRTVSGALVGIGLFVTFAAPVMAQAKAAPAAGRGLDDAGTGVGLTYVTQWSPVGFGVDFSKYIKTVMRVRTIDVVGELTFNSFDSHNDTNVVGGARWVRHTESGHALFAQALGGVTHQSYRFTSAAGGENDFRLQLGGGIDFPLSGNTYLIRVQNDYPIVFTRGQTKLYLRFSAGLEFHFNK